MNHPPALSIVVPTHNRRAVLARSLAALGRQTWPASEFEVLVVADACDDDTAAMVTACAANVPFRLRVFSHAAKSASATRNLGATNAHGHRLLFLDDDVIAEPGLVSAHLADRHRHAVVVGYSKPELPRNPSLWHYDARRWWEDTYTEMKRPDHRFHYRDVFSGNLSLEAALFHQVGGFDVSFTGRLEDYELGLRLLKAGASVHFDPEAVGYHCDDTDLRRWLRRIRQEGVADLQIGQRHAELRASLFGSLAEPSDRRIRWVRQWAFRHPEPGDRLELWLLNLADHCERLRLRHRWRQLVAVLRELNYWRGVAVASGGQRALAAWLQEAPAVPAITSDAPVIDVATLRDDAQQSGLLEQGTAKGARLTFDGIEMLTLPTQFGAEPLRVEHLQRSMREALRRQFVPVLALKLIRNAKAGGVC